MKKLIKINLKQKIWLIACLSLLLFLCGPMMQIMSYENAKMYSATFENLINTMELFFLPNVMTDYIPTFLSSVVTAIVFFSYLFSKKRVDLFHSIPIDRKHLFTANYVSGVLVYVVPLVAKFLLGLFIAVPNQYMTLNAFKYMVLTFICNMIHFLFGYSVTICAVMLTGNIVVSVLAAGVLAFAFPVTASLLEYFERYFYITFTDCNLVKETVLTKYYWFSPLTSYAKIIQDLSYQVDGDNSIPVLSTYGALIIIAIAVAFVTALAYFLYMKRPSEAAEKTIAFKKSDDFIRMPITVLGGFLGAWFMSVSMTGFRTKWIWLGVILGVVITHCVMEVILKESFKCFFNNKIQLVIALLVASCVIGIFYTDATKYDKYIPARDQIKSAGIYFGSVDEGLSCVEVKPNPNEPGCYITSYKGFVDYSFSDRFTDSVMIDKVYAVSQIGVSCVDDMLKNAYANQFGGELYNDANYKYAMAYDEPKMADDELYSDESEEITDEEAYEQAFAWMDEVGISEIPHESKGMSITVQIAYELNSGRMVLREYDIPVAKIKTAMNEIYKTEEYKTKHFDVIKAYEMGAINKAEVFDAYENKALSLTDAQKNEFMDIYLEELKAMTIDTISQLPIGRVTMSIKTSEKYEDSLMGYYIYPEFKNTLAFIEKYGYDMSGFSTEVPVEKITNISVNSYNLYGYSESDMCYADSMMYTSNKDEEAIKEIANGMMNSTYLWSNQTLIYNAIGTDVQGADLTVSSTADNGIIRSYSVLYKKGQLPERLKKDIAVEIWRNNR